MAKIPGSKTAQILFVVCVLPIALLSLMPSITPKNYVPPPRRQANIDTLRAYYAQQELQESGDPYDPATLTLEHLVERDAGNGVRLVDPWGTPYTLTFNAEDRSFECRSAGPDKAMMTADDHERTWPLKGYGNQ